MEGSYLSYLPEDIIYNILYKSSFLDIVSDIHTDILFTVFLSYNPTLSSCYNLITASYQYINVEKYHFLNDVRLCLVITPKEYNTATGINPPEFPYYYYVTYFKRELCPDIYANISRCYITLSKGTPSGVYYDNNFWKGLTIAILSDSYTFNPGRTIPGISFPDFVNYRAGYPTFINIMKIRYIISTVPHLDARYGEYVQNKLSYEVNVLKALEKNLYKITLTKLMISPGELFRGSNLVMYVMLSSIHNIDTDSLEILYHVLTSPKTKQRVLYLYESECKIRWIGDIIAPYVSKSRGSPHISDYYFIPIMNVVKEATNFKSFVNFILDRLETNSDYDIQKINEIRRLYG